MCVLTCLCCTAVSLLPSLLFVFCIRHTVCTGLQYLLTCLDQRLHSVSYLARDSLRPYHFQAPFWLVTRAKSFARVTCVAVVNNGFTKVVRRASAYSDIFQQTKPKSCDLQHSRRYRNIFQQTSHVLLFVNRRRLWSAANWRGKERKRCIDAEYYGKR